MAIALDTGIRRNKTVSELEADIDRQIIARLAITHDAKELQVITTSYCSEDDCSDIIEIYTKLGWSTEKTVDLTMEAILFWVLKRN